jgi:hypothetical protein
MPQQQKSDAFLHQQNFSVIDWPRNSLDLNPIKNLWSIIKGQLKKRENITSLPLLIKAMKEIWGHPAQAPDGQAGPLHADKNQDVPGECWPDD